MEDSAEITMDGIGTVVPSWATSQVALPRAAYGSVYESIRQKLLPPPAYRTRAGQFVRSRTLAQVLDKLDLDFFEERPFEQILLQTWPGLDRMKGRIATKEKCPICGARFEQRMKGLICGECWTRPNRYMLVIPGRRRKDRIFGDKRGLPLSSWEQAALTLFDVSRDIAAGRFDPENYRVRSTKRKMFVTVGDSLLTKKTQEILEDSKASEGQKKGVKSWRAKYRKYVRPYFEKDLIDEVRGKRLEQFLLDLRQSVGNPKMFKHIRAVVREILRYAASTMNVIEATPEFPRVRPPVRDEEETPVDAPWLTQDEQCSVIQRVVPDAQPILRMITGAGLRPGEAYQLQVTNVVARPTRLDLRVLKGKANHRTIGLDQELGRFTAEYLRKRAGMNAVASARTLLFLTTEGKRFTDNKLERRWNSAVRIAISEGVLAADKRCTVNQAGRHSKINQLLAQGKTVEEIATYCGTSAEMIRKYYQHFVSIPHPTTPGTNEAPAAEGVL